MDGLEGLEFNIRCGKAAIEKMNVDRLALNERMETEEDKEHKATLAAELCGVAYGILFLASEVRRMEQAHGWLSSATPEEREAMFPNHFTADANLPEDENFDSLMRKMNGFSL